MSTTPRNTPTEYVGVNLNMLESIEEFCSFGQAARRLGVSKPTFARIVRVKQLSVFGDPRDRRRKLLKLLDVEHLCRVSPLEGAGDEVVSAR